MRTIQEQLIEKELSNGLILEKEPVKVAVMKPAKKALSTWELAELMGTNRDTFRRVRGGAIRRR